MQVGDKVKIKKTSKFYSQAPDSPGIITDIISTHKDWCHVEFESGYADNYRFRGPEIDLELIPKSNFNAEAIKAIRKAIAQK